MSMSTEVPIPDDLIPGLNRKPEALGSTVNSTFAPSYPGTWPARERSTKFWVAFVKRSPLAAYRTQN